ncbi:MAG: UDP-N-acetylglucosamine 1-carboxyvinyltransferase [Christensenellales bacterium]
MYQIVVGKSRPLRGNAWVSSAKNAVLPLLAAALLTDCRVIIEEVPRLEDIIVMVHLIDGLGADARMSGGNVIIENARLQSEAVSPAMKKLRGSLLLLGPLLAKKGEAKLALPGGCKIGQRPYDLHIRGMQALGATVELQDDYIIASASKLSGGEISLDYPSVGATENIMMAAVCAEGRTIINNAAKEPEIVDLAKMLIKMGACIDGAGTGKIEIYGVHRLNGVVYRPIPDRIEAGTLMLCAAVTGGDITLYNICPAHMKAVSAKLLEAGSMVLANGSTMRVIAPPRLKAVDVVSLPYPGYPTDLQAQMMAACCLGIGESRIRDAVFQERFSHVEQLKRMGAQIDLEYSCATIRGKAVLEGAEVMATDLRAGAAMMIAGLKANGLTRINGVQHIDRGYESLETKLGMLGANIRRLRL